MTKHLFAALLLPLTYTYSLAEANKDESQVPAYTLPTLLPPPPPKAEGEAAKAQSAAQVAAWQAQRPLLLKAFAEQMYGVTPIGRPDALKFVVREEKSDARGGRATRLRVGVLFEGNEEGRKMELLVYLPNDVAVPAPIFLGLNFDGNYTTVTDADLPVPTHFATGLFDNKPKNHEPDASARGMHAYMWSLDVLLEHGYGLATAACGEIEPDAPDRWKEGVRGLAKEPGPADWGTIGAWAWGLSRAMDYLETNPRVDAKKVAVMGFSRLGKAAVWAGAQDERFAAVISNASGAGGIALSKRIFGERVSDLVTRFPHWFAKNFAAYAGKEETLPFDQHQLAALIAPRPLLATSGTTDLWSDPKGEFLTLQAAQPVYDLLDTKGLDAQEWPKPDKLVNSPLGYYLREGGHDVTLADWRAMISFASKQLHTTPPPFLAAERYARRIAALPADQQAAWKAYFTQSDALRKIQDDLLAAEVTAAGLTAPKEAPHGENFEHDTDDSAKPLLANDEGATLAATMISWQLPCGGWSKAVSYAASRTPGTAWTAQSDARHYAGTLDNRATTEQLSFLALRQEVTPDDRVQAAAERGLDYLLNAQFPNGGWPQVYPLEGSYHDSLTLNDDVLVHVLTVLKSAAAGTNGWTWLDAQRKALAQTAYEKGLKVTFDLQVNIKGKPTLWAAQYDLITLQPVSARGYELAGLSGGESTNLLKFLFTVRPVTKEVTAAIEAGMAWLAAHRLPGSEETWSRFYDLSTELPFFPGKDDGKAYPTEAAMRKTNPGGYAFTVKKAKDLPKWHGKWLKSLAKETKEAKGN